jgi:hypothetical protein
MGGKHDQALNQFLKESIANFAVALFFIGAVLLYVRFYGR